MGTSRSGGATGHRGSAGEDLHKHHEVCLDVPAAGGLQPRHGRHVQEDHEGDCLPHLQRRLLWREQQNLYDLAVGAAMEKCMQLAPAIDLINLLSPRNQFNSLFPSVNRKNPFEQFQAYKDIDQLTSLWRNKRSADASSGLIQIDEDDFIEFLEDFADYKGNMATKIGNLTCVMTELKVNIKEYTKDMAEVEEFDLTETEIVADPEWRARLSRGYQDCYDISESIPSQALTGNPLKRMFGRQMMFFKCAKKNEVTNCALGQMKRWVEQFYGTANNLTEYGLPEDAYEAAGLGLMVLNNAASEEEQFVSDFFWGASGH